MSSSHDKGQDVAKLTILVKALHERMGLPRNTEVPKAIPTVGRPPPRVRGLQTPVLAK